MPTKRINRLFLPKPHQSKDVPASATERKRVPSFCFLHLTDDVKALEETGAPFLQRLIRQLRTFSEVGWNRVAEVKGLRWDAVPQRAMDSRFHIPTYLKRTSLYHIGVGDGRVWGYREGDVFHIVWLDPDHEVTP